MMEDGLATKPQLQYTDDKKNTLTITKVWEDYRVTINGQSVVVSESFVQEICAAIEDGTIHG